MPVPPDSKIRINKHLADKGLATRKGADELIEAGKVFVNGTRAVLGQKVGTEDKVEVKGGGAATTPHRYVAYNKPAGYVTHSPAEDEKEIADIFSLTLSSPQLPASISSRGGSERDGARFQGFASKRNPVPSGRYAGGKNTLFPVGRLDKNSEGLLILTNDGRITDRLLNPKYDHEKEYAVEVSSAVGESFRKKLESGVNIEISSPPARGGVPSLPAVLYSAQAGQRGGVVGEKYLTKPCKVNLIDSHHFTIALTEGKKHQIKRMTEALGVSVVSLKRLRVMNVKLGNQKTNTGREIAGKELQTFLKSLGLTS